MIETLQARPVAEAHAKLGEGPVWHPVDRTLDWTDIPSGELHRFDPRSGRDTVIHSGTPIGSFAPRRAGGYVLAGGTEISILEPGAGEPRVIATRPDDVAGTFNDGKCDPHGCFWVGTSTYPDGGPNGALLRLDAEHRLHVMLRGMIISNGLDWTDGMRRMYYVDSFAFGLDELDLSESGDEVVRRTRLVDIENDTESPFGFTVADGLALDDEGHAWVAIHGTGEVRRYSPTGQLDRVVQLPTLGATSVAFGGDDLGDLYITSGSILPPGDPRADPLDGALFVCRPGVRGRPMHLFAG